MSGLIEAHWLSEQADKCIEAMVSACGGYPETFHALAVGAKAHDLTIAYVHREGPPKGVVVESDLGERVAVVFFGDDVWGAYSVAVHEWAEHLMRIDCCEPCVINAVEDCEIRHAVADMVAEACIKAARMAKAAVYVRTDGPLTSFFNGHEVRTR